MSLSCEVAYVGPQGQFLIAISLPAGATIADAIAASGLARRLPDLRIADDTVGVWSEPRPLSCVLRDGDRVVIYRDLLADPKQARRQRATRDATRRR